MPPSRGNDSSGVVIGLRPNNVTDPNSVGVSEETPPSTYHWPFRLPTGFGTLTQVVIQPTVRRYLALASPRRGPEVGKASLWCRSCLVATGQTDRQTDRQKGGPSPWLKEAQRIETKG
jgi:hypothetical protein